MNEWKQRGYWKIDNKNFSVENDTNSLEEPISTLLPSQIQMFELYRDSVVLSNLHKGLVNTQSIKTQKSEPTTHSKRYDDKW